MQYLLHNKSGIFELLDIYFDLYRFFNLSGVLDCLHI